MNFKEWVYKELAEGTFKQKGYYLIWTDNDCYLDIQKLMPDILNMKKRYQKAYNSDHWGESYVPIGKR